MSRNFMKLYKTFHRLKSPGNCESGNRERFGSRVSRGDSAEVPGPRAGPHTAHRDTRAGPRAVSVSLLAAAEWWDQCRGGPGGRELQPSAPNATPWGLWPGSGRPAPVSRANGPERAGTRPPTRGPLSSPIPMAPPRRRSCSGGCGSALPARHREG